jgi:predicted transcriptional regulator
MAGRKTLAITDRQFELLGLLWDHGPLTVRELLERLPGGAGLPYTTVLGLLQGMERAGLVSHEAQKQAHRYRARVSREEGTGSLLADFLRRFFRGSAERLVLSLVSARHLSAEDLREIEARLAQSPPPDRPDAPPPRGRRGRPRRPS